MPGIFKKGQKGISTKKLCQKLVPFTDIIDRAVQVSTAAGKRRSVRGLPDGAEAQAQAGRGEGEER